MSADSGPEVSTRLSMTDHLPSNVDIIDVCHNSLLGDQKIHYQGNSTLMHAGHLCVTHAFAGRK